MSGFWGAVTGAASVAITFAIVEWIARSSSESRVFYIAIGRERTAEDEARVLRVRVVNAACAFVALAGFFLPIGPTLTLIATMGATTVSLVWLMVEMTLVLRSAELEEIPSRYAISIDDPPPARDYVSMPLQIANILVVVLPTVLFVWLVGQLPASMAMQYDTAGHVNRYGAPSELWILLPLMVFDLVLLWGIVYGISRERWALPEEGAVRYTELAMQRRTLMVRLTEWIMLLVNAGMAVAWIGIALSGLPGWEDIIGAVVALTVALSCLGAFAPLVVYLPRLLKVSDELRKIAGTEVLGTRKSGWRWGGTVYYAPEDPALFVPKRVGIGQTFNFARPLAWVILIGIVLIPLAISLGVAWFE